MKKWDVSIVGEVFIDHVFSGFDTWPSPGEEIHAKHYTRELGGGAAITACGLSKLGRSVNLIGVIGAADADWFETRLAQFGLARDGLRRVAGWTATSVSISTRSDRSFFTYAGANQHLHQELANDSIIAELQDARHVHFAMPLARELAAKLLPALTHAGCSLSLDVGFQPAWLAERVNLSTCQEVDYFLPNEKEAALLCGSDRAEAYLTFARQKRFRQAVLKLGARGAMAVEGDAVRTVSPPAVEALDSTGAGDAFDAAFIDAVLDAAPTLERLRRACVGGALSTRAAGALGGFPDRNELRSVYEQSYGT